MTLMAVPQDDPGGPVTPMRVLQEAQEPAGNSPIALLVIVLLLLVATSPRKRARVPRHLGRRSDLGTASRRIVELGTY